MNAKGKAMMMAAMAAAMMGGSMGYESPSQFHDDGKPLKKVLPKGMKEFIIDGKVYHAINYKNALRKSGRGK